MSDTTTTNSKPYLSGTINNTNSLGMMQNCQQLLATMAMNTPGVVSATPSLSMANSSSSTTVGNQRIPPHLRTPARPTSVTAVQRNNILSSINQ